MKITPALFLHHHEKYCTLINIGFLFFFLLLSSSQILSQMTPQTITEIDALLGNKPHSKKELRA